MQNEKVNGNGPHCAVCRKPNANWVVEWNGFEHPVHNQQGWPEAERCSQILASSATRDVVLRLFLSPQVRAEKKAERVLNCMDKAQKEGCVAIRLPTLRARVKGRGLKAHDRELQPIA